ncbi:MULTISPECIES: phosphotransferase [Nocardia]|uniref:Phosphotransferase n=1 Tax=Nocardia implantans TaxID=3108168 RepID=A0ABU6ANM6_9NOCA|nr:MULTISPECIES: phosphotransferase [unclassified Nocardia]MBF6192149.1 phosphotransferase [Nocardia beijingensis]MEA3530282.1 phosphotransferase [Nocardia sp. CDC192]MEB3508990.1 phosphotransferase [Nocardia sp. CDC186]
MTGEVAHIPAVMDPRGLESTLRATHRLSSTEHVDDVAVHRLAQSGLVGEVLRLSIRYDRPSGSGPESLIFKEASDRFTESRHLAEVELGFYRYHEAHPTPIDVPAVLAQGPAPAPWLLMEDLGDDGFVRQIDGCPPDLAFRAITALATMHAWGWNRALPADWDWLLPPANSPVGAICRRRLRGYGGDWPTALGPLPALVIDGFEDVAAMLAPPQRTIAHGDFHSQNIHFGPHRCRFIDFQFLQHASGMLDVARFLATSLTTEIRRAIEGDLLRAYHDRLAELGAAREDTEQWTTELRAGLLWNFCTPLTLRVIGLEQSRGSWPARLPILERCAAAADDWAALDLLR